VHSANEFQLAQRKEWLKIVLILQACYLGAATTPCKYIRRVIDARIGSVQFAGCLRGKSA
jgi:hypothetical protein